MAPTANSRLSPFPLRLSNNDSYIDIKPEMLNWAIQRARLGEDASQSAIIQRAHQWISGKKQPTLVQLDTFAKKVMVPFGYLFLDSPPEEPLPIADFCTFGDHPLPQPSPNLLDTIRDMQVRQDWMRDEMMGLEMEPVSFVSSIDKTATAETAAQQIRNSLGFPENWTQDCRDEDDCFTKLRQAADQLGILVFRNGVVLSFYTSILILGNLGKLVKLSIVAGTEQRSNS